MCRLTQCCFSSTTGFFVTHSTIDIPLGLAVSELAAFTEALVGACEPPESFSIISPNCK